MRKYFFAAWTLRFNLESSFNPFFKYLVPIFPLDSFHLLDVYDDFTIVLWIVEFILLIKSLESFPDSTSASTFNFFSDGGEVLRKDSSNFASKSSYFLF